MGWLWSSNNSPDTQSPPPQPSAEQSPLTSPSIAPQPASTPLEQQTQQQKDATDFASAFPHLQNQPTTTSDPSPTPEFSPYPTALSCRDLFDSAFYCQSLGGKFNDIYRHGELKSCSQHWSDFWFCMRNKGKPEFEKSAHIREFWEERERRVKRRGNSEDVWGVRDLAGGEGVRGAFGKSFED